MQICDMDVVGSQGGAGSTSGSDKWKENKVSTGPAAKACSQSPSSDTGASTDHSTLPEKKRRLFHSAGTSVGGPPPAEQQVPSKATMGQVHGSNGNGGFGAMHVDVEKAPEAAMREVVVAAISKEAVAAPMAKEAAAAATAKEATVVAVVREMVAKEATRAAVVKRASNAMPNPKAAARKTALTVESSGTSGGEPRATQVDVTPDPKAVAKRLAAKIGLGGSSPPRKRFHYAWR
jgi:hypothetical protein